MTAARRDSTDPQTSRTLERGANVTLQNATRTAAARPAITDVVKEKYGAVAESALSNNHDGVAAVAEAFGYSPEDLSSIPSEANMGLSCGNPIALASLRPGETVVDLGSGGGLDVFLASRRVGPTGRAIGIDMTPQMVERARRAAAADRQYANVEFHLASIDALPLPDHSVDCVISNCVINLAADKRKVFAEMFRVLKPGGRVAVSDIALRQPLPAEIARDVEAYVGCVAGAIEIAEYQRGLRDAGFAAVQVIDANADLNAYTKIGNGGGCCGGGGGGGSGSEASANETKVQPKSAGGCCGSSPASPCCSTEPATSAEADLHTGLTNVLDRHNVNEYAASVKVLAVKPR
jgi:SAM-dependent methyltransferase